MSSTLGKITGVFILVAIACQNSSGQTQNLTVQGELKPQQKKEVTSQPDEKKPTSKQVARGIVFNDTNGNGKFDSLEPRMSSVKVSNGVEIVQTKPNGTYEIPVTDDSIVFVIKPRGWATPLDENKLPQFDFRRKSTECYHQIIARKKSRASDKV